MTIADTDELSTVTESWATWLLILVAVVLHWAALQNAQPLQSANDRSRWCTVWSLVERGTFQIDEIRRHPGWDSIDILYDDGHFYSTKPPILSVVVAGITWCIQRVTHWNLLANTHQLTMTVLCVVNLLPFAVSLALLSGMLQRLGSTSWSRLFVLSAAAFGTLATPFLTTLNNHTVAVAGVIVSLYALERIHNSERPSGWWFALCGGSTAWVICNELPAALFGLVMFFLVWKKSPSRAIGLFGPVAILVLGAFLATNVVATGSWKPSYAAYGSSKYNFVIDGVPSYWMEPHGVDRNLDSPAMYFVHCTIGHHGILSLTPLFALAIAGWFLSSSNQSLLKTLIRTGILLIFVNLAFYMTRTQNYNYGGVSCGLRWALWLIPFWLLGLVPILDATARSPVARLLSLGLLAGSIASAWTPNGNPWQQPWLFRSMTRLGWIDYSDKPPSLPRALWSWFPSIPTTMNDSLPWVEFSSERADGNLLRRRLEVERIRQEQSGAIADLRVRESTVNSDWQTTHQFSIDVAAFDAGAATADFLQWSDPAVTEDQQQRDMTFVRGLPLKREYRAGKIHYVKTSLRRDAFRCQLAAAAVDSKSANGKTLRYRCDVSLCDELPFGVADVEFQITDPEGKGTLSHEKWTVSDCFPKVSPTSPLSRAHTTN